MSVMIVARIAINLKRFVCEAFSRFCVSAEMKFFDHMRNELFKRILHGVSWATIVGEGLFVGSFEDGEIAHDESCAVLKELELNGAVWLLVRVSGCCG